MVLTEDPIGFVFLEDTSLLWPLSYENLKYNALRPERHPITGTPPPRLLTLYYSSGIIHSVGDLGCYWLFGYGHQHISSTLITRKYSKRSGVCDNLLLT